MTAFSKQMAAFAKKTDQKIDDVVTATVFEMSARIINMTPVGNPDIWKGKPPAGYTGGQAKGNWFASLNAPSGLMDTDIRDVSGGVAISRMTTIASKANGEIFYLVNNLPYIRALEFGHSTQAPEGMVRVTTADFKVAIAKALATT